MSPTKTRVIAFFVFMALFSTTFQLGTMQQVSEEEATLFMEEFEELIKDIDGMGIFLHNTTIAIPMFIPGFGVMWGMFSAVSTGYAFAAITTLSPELGQIPPLSILFLTPFGVMELVAYSLATSRSFILIWIIIKKTGLRPHVNATVIEIGIVLALLLTGGFLEYYMIELAMDGALPFFEQEF